MLRWHGTLSAIVFVAMLAVGNPQQARGQLPKIDACTLLTQAEVSLALGAQVGPGGSIVAHICSWYVPGTPKGVTLILYSPKRYEELKESPVPYGPPKISLVGVGDEATFGVVPNFATTLLIKKGTVVFMVRLEGLASGEAPREVEQMAKSLALDVMAKL
jgi:hypothetical protein